jgi:thymidylate kinase
MEEKIKNMSNNKNTELLDSVLKFLNETIPYAVLRNFEGLPYNNDSRDIDIIIEKADFKKIQNRLIIIFEDLDWEIITYLNSDRLITYVCARKGDDKTEIVQWDFFFNTSAFGVLLMDAPEFLQHRQFNGVLYHVSKECEFLDKYLYVRAVGGKYPAKYEKVKEAVADNEIVISKLNDLFSVPSVSVCNTVSGRKLITQAVFSNFKKRPFDLFCDIVWFLYTFIRNYLRSNTGFSIGFTGPDGSGKTTVLTALHQQLSPVFATATVFFHFRPGLFPNAGETAYHAGLKKDVDRKYDKPHRGGKTGIFSSVIRLLYYSMDYIIGYFLKVKSACRITKIVIFDRYYTDIIVDSRRSRIFLNHKFLYWFGELFIPKLDYNILLTADRDIILSRKQELNEEGIDSINEKLNYLSDKKGYYLIMNNSQPEEAVQKILSIIFENQHEKNLKRIKK